MDRVVFGPDRVLHLVCCPMCCEEGGTKCGGRADIYGRPRCVLPVRSPPRMPNSRTDQERPPLALFLLSHTDPCQPNRPDAPAGDPRASGAEAVNVAGKAPNVREWPEAATVLVPMRCATAVPWPIEHRHSDSALLHMRVDEGIVLVNGNTNSTSTGIRSSILRASSARQAP